MREIMNSEKFYEITTKAMGSGERAGRFAAHVSVWSETAVRVAIYQAIKMWEKQKPENLDGNVQ